jgi:hypothetical protein
MIPVCLSERSMIGHQWPKFPGSGGFLKSPHRIDDHDGIDPILDYLLTSGLSYGGISCDMGIPRQTLSDW